MNEENLNNEIEFVPRRLEDNKAINKASQAIVNYAKQLNTIKDVFTKFFGYFELSDFIELYNASDKSDWIVNKWIKIKNINTKGLNINTMFKSNLIDIPDYNDLISRIQNNFNYLKSVFIDHILNDFTELYDAETESFINPLLLDDSPVFERLIMNYSYQTQNQVENEFLNVIDKLAEIYDKLLNKYKLSPQYLPIEFLKLEMSGNYKVVTPSYHVVKQFRRSGRENIV